MKDKRASSIGLSAKTLPHQDRPKHSGYISQEDYKAIMKLYFKRVMYHMIKTGDKFIIPQFLGSLQIIRYNFDKWNKQKDADGNQYNRTMVDFHNTMKLRKEGINKTVKLKCKSTGGYWWKAHWYKSVYARFKTQSLYKFEFVRPNIRSNSYNKNNPELSIVPFFRDKGWEIYYELPSYKERNKYD